MSEDLIRDYPELAGSKHLRWGPYVRILADALGLKDWVFIVDETLPDSGQDTAAQIHCVYGRKLATIRLCPAFDDYSAEKQREILTHELVHAHLDGVMKAYESLCGYVHRDAYDLVESRVRMEIERATDGVAFVLSRFMPLPPAREE